MLAPFQYIVQRGENGKIVEIPCGENDLLATQNLLYATVRTMPCICYRGRPVAGRKEVVYLPYTWNDFWREMPPREA